MFGKFEDQLFNVFSSHHEIRNVFVIFYQRDIIEGNIEMGIRFYARGLKGFSSKLGAVY